MATQAGDDELVENTPGYKAPAKVDLETLKNLDADDEVGRLICRARCRADCSVYFWVLVFEEVEGQAARGCRSHLHWWPQRDC
jgi:hypothetical protein